MMQGLPGLKFEHIYLLTGIEPIPQEWALIQIRTSFHYAAVDSVITAA